MSTGVLIQDTGVLIQDATKLCMQMFCRLEVQLGSIGREPAMAILCPDSPVTTVLVGVASWLLP